MPLKGNFSICSSLHQGQPQDLQPKEALRRPLRPRHQDNSATALSTGFTAVLMPSPESSCEEETGHQEFSGRPKTSFGQPASKAPVWPLCSRCQGSCLSSCSKPSVKPSRLLLGLPSESCRRRQPVLRESCPHHRPI